MANTNEIAQINKINKELTSLNSTIDQTAAGVMKVINNLEYYEKTSRDLTATTDNLLKAQRTSAETSKEMEALNKALLKSEQDLAKSETAMNEQIIRNTTEKSKNNQATKDKIKWYEADEGSLVRMRLRLKELTEQYDKAGTRTKEAAKEINNLSKEIGKAEEATNRHQRNVGNYAEAFGKFKGVVAGLPGPLGNAASAAEGLVVKLGAFGPVGLWVGGLIMSIGAPLIAFFTKSEKGAEMLQRKIEGLKASVSVLIGELIGAGDKMTESFEEPSKTPFWTALLSGFGTSGAALGARMDYARVSAEKYTLQLQKMEDEERKLIVPRAESNLKIKEAMLLYADSDQSLSVRVEALKEAIKLENETADVEIKMAHDRVENLKVINTEKANAKQLRDSDDLALQNAIAKEIELRTESVGRQTRAAKRVATATEEIRKEDIEKNKAANEQKKKDDERAAYGSIELEKMVAKETTVTHEDGLKSNQDYLDAKLKQAEEEAAAEIQLKEDIKQAEIDLAIETGNAIFEFRRMAFDKQLMDLEEEKKAKLSNTKLTSEQKAKIEAEYQKKENEIKRKQAINDKLQALFNIAINTAVGISKAIPNVPLIIFSAVMGALQAALVLAQPIPKFSKGTLSAPERGLFGEAGMELMMLRDNSLMMADKPTYFEGSKFKGARIYSNQETKQMMGMSNRGIRGQSINDERIIAGLEKLNNTIKSKPVAIYDKEHRQIGLATSTHQEIYLNRLTR